MNRTSALILLAGVVIAFTLGLLLGTNITQGRRAISDSAGNPLIAPEARSSETQAPRRPFQQPRDENAPRAAEVRDVGSGFQRLLIDTAGDAPRACLQFAETLDRSKTHVWADYVRLTPQEQIVATAEGRSLCLAGLKFNVDYDVTIRAGLPFADQQSLPQNVSTKISFGDKPAYVGFASDGVILPRIDADGLGIETVNVNRVKISVYRVPDRALFQKSIVSGETASADDYLYVYGEEDGEDLGKPVFENELNVKGAANETAVTVFGLAAAVRDVAPGAYFVRLRDASPAGDPRRRAEAYRWIVNTDLAISSVSSKQALDVFVRSIASGRPLPNLNVELIARNNEVLGRTTTGLDGRARFERAAISGAAPLDPKLVLAYGPQDDFAALDLQRAALDLSTFDVGGRKATPMIEAMTYFDRGVYRPGETVRLTGLLRDNAGKAVERPLTLTIRRPNGAEWRVIRVESFETGGFVNSFELPSSAPRGIWRIGVAADGVGSIGANSFSVEDFVPQRLAVALEVDETRPITTNETRPIGVEARYLYGAPASDLPVEGEARLRVDPNPFPAHSRFRFGLVEGRFDERIVKLAPAITNAAGEATLQMTLNTPAKSDPPLRADVVVGVVEPGGRAVRESARIPVRGAAQYVGLALAVDGGGFGQGKAAEIDAILVDPQGSQLTGEIEWQIFEEDYWFDWYRDEGQWRWRRSFKDILKTEGRTSIAAGAPARIVEKLEPGSYRLSAIAPGGGAPSDIRFYVGWRSQGAGADRPDEATMTLTSENVAPGARARLFLSAPYAGEALVTVATDRVHSVQRLRVDEGGREILIDTDPSWGAGFYVLATIVTPRSPADIPVPRRAMGLTYVPMEISDRKLAMTLSAPDVVRPRQSVGVAVKVAGAARGEKVMLTLAAVDEGILRLTKFASPDPVEYFFGKKALGVEVRDDYGRILNANLGAAARFGGDQIGGEGLTVVPTKSVAIFSGPVALGPNGEAVVTLDIPDFNGELRLMGVAWSATRLGSTARPLTVRDEAPALLALPRFLAPGDEARAALLVDNVEGRSGDYSISVSSDGALSADFADTLALAPGQSRRVAVPLRARELGVATIDLNLKGPAGIGVERAYPIQVRTPFMPVTETSVRSLQPGESISLTSALIAPFSPEAVATSVSFSRLRGIDPAPLLQSLIRYPYGCSEQLTSVARPLLSFNALGSEIGADPDPAVRARVQGAVNDLLDRQGPDGAFGLWREGDRGASGWLGAYITEFLLRARQDGYAIPDTAISRALNAMSEVSRIDRYSNVDYVTGSLDDAATAEQRLGASTYAHYVLTLAGRGDLSELRYLHDSLLDRMRSPLTLAHLGAALSRLGDRARALNAFSRANEAIGWDDEADYYQTPLRDAAGLVAAMAETASAPQFDVVTDRFASLIKDPDELHTQEKAYLLAAARALLDRTGDVSIARDGAPAALSGPAPAFELTAGDLAKGATFRNDSQGPLFVTTTVSGATIAAPAASSSGLEIIKRIATEDGRDANLSAVRQSSRFVVVLSGRALADRRHPVIVADLLPAGFEIEAVLRPEDGAGENVSGPYKWIGPISTPKIAEARDDRFVAAIDLRQESFTLAYLVRAVTPGRFTLPGVVIEDMYRPGVYARTATQTVAIAAE